MHKRMLELIAAMVEPHKGDSHTTTAGQIKLTALLLQSSWRGKYNHKEEYSYPLRKSKRKEKQVIFLINRQTDEVDSLTLSIC